MNCDMNTIWRGCLLHACLSAIFFCAIVPAALASDPWANIGLQKPSGIDVGVDRRLRLLPVLPEIQTAIKARGTAYFDDHGPGFAVGLVLGDGLYYSKGFGWRDAAKHNRPDESTLFWVGSLTKVFTGTALLTLIGTPSYHMALDDDLVQKHWADELSSVCYSSSVEPCPANGDPKITFRNLVSHTSGLPNVLSPDGGNISDTEWLNELKTT
jgi:CubicO group peptidase (beta-lactamase class C family)